MKSMKKDWYKKIWTMDIQNMSWVEDTKKEVDFLLNPTSEYQEMPFKIKNVDKGIELFISELDKGGDIGILVDTDV